MKIVYSNLDLSLLEKRISEKLEVCELWADLQLSQDEYNVLRQKISDILPMNSNGRDYLMQMVRYPLCFITQIIFYLVFNYQDEFWTPWAQSLDINIDANQTRDIGKEVIRIFDQYHFKYDIDGYKYITPMQCQAGIPFSYLDDLFDLVVSENQQVLDTFSIINELLGWKSAVLHKPVFRYINAYRDKAAALLADVNEIVNSSAKGSFTDGYDENLLRRFDEWRSQTKEMAITKKKDLDYPFPTLAFSDDGHGIGLNLPMVISKNEYASKIRWVIIPDEENLKETEITCNYVKNSYRLYTHESFLSITPSETYKVSLYDDISQDKALSEHVIVGLAQNSYVIFDENGKRLLDSSLPAKQGYLVIRGSQLSPEFSNANYERLDLPVSTKDCHAWYFAPENVNAKVVLKSTLSSQTISMRTMLDVSLKSARYLFGEKPVAGTLGLFIDFPSLSFDLVDRNKIGDLILTIRHRQSGHKSMGPIDIKLSKDGAIKLDDFLGDFGCPYGIYDLRIYEKTAFRKSLSFAYVPEVDYNEDDLNPWPAKYSNVSRTGFMFQNSDLVTIDITSDAKVEQLVRHGVLWTRVEIDTPIAEIFGTITWGKDNDQISLPWNKKVRFLNWSFWDENQMESISCYETKLIESNELAESRMWLSIWMLKDRLVMAPFLALYNKSGKMLQQIAIGLNPLGKLTVSLDVFLTTMESNKLPLQIQLVFFEGEEERHIVLAQITESILLSGLRFHCDDRTGKPMFIWKADKLIPSEPVLMRGITEPDYQQTIYFNKVHKTKSGLYYGIFLKKVVPSGMYKIEPIIEDDFFLEEEGYKPPSLRGENVICVEIQKLNNGLHTVTDILKMALVVENDEKRLNKLIEIFNGHNETIVPDISEETCKLLVCIICNYSDENNPCSQLIMKLVDQINVQKLNGVHRANFIKWILSYNLSSTERKVSFIRLDLFLAADLEATVLTAKEVHILGEIDSEMELFWMLHKRMTNHLAPKLTDIVGTEALKEILNFPKEKSEADWETYLQNAITGTPPSWDVMITKELAGQSEQFRDLFDWGVGNKMPRLDLTRRSEKGLYFCGQTYMDLLVRWYLNKQQNHIDPSTFSEELSPLYPDLDRLKPILQCADRKLTDDYYLQIDGRNMHIKTGIFPMFYYTAIAAFASACASRKLLTDEQFSPAQKLLIKMMRIFPELAKRDLLMCELLLFFQGRS